ncbi:MAG: hypothetical protein QM739_08350 [Propionivibrio sp.]
MWKSLLSLVLLSFSGAVWAEAGFGGPSCPISNYFNIDYYLGKSYLRIPKKIRSVSPGGNVEYQEFWEVLDDNLSQLKLYSEDIDGVFFEVYKKKIYSISLHFKKEALLSGRVVLEDIISSCGKQYDNHCSELDDARTVIRSQYGDSLVLSDAKLDHMIYHIPFCKKNPCR